MLNATHVFGISTDILKPSYVDRGDLDQRLSRLLQRDSHVALRGESKSGKSWLRKAALPDAITIQCRIQKKIQDIYSDALGQLGLKFLKEETVGGGIETRLEANAEIGNSLLAKLAAKLGLAVSLKTEKRYIPIGQDIENLKLFSEVILESGRRLVIEDFHYLASEERRLFAFDLKALWDYQVFVIIIGVWAENNLLVHLNSDLTGRIEEIPIVWSPAELAEVINKGSSALNIVISPRIVDAMVKDAHGIVGILQLVALNFLEKNNIFEVSKNKVTLDDYEKFQSVALEYAEQLNATYQTFASRISTGIRKRKKSTGIWAHMLKTVLEADDGSLERGLPVQNIFQTANGREKRIQLGNLRQVLLKLNEMQIDADGRGLILAFDIHRDTVFIVDKQLLFYRKYATVRWPWEDIITDINQNETGYEADGLDAE